MKKLISLLIAILICTNLGLPAFATFDLKNEEDVSAAIKTLQETEYVPGRSYFTAYSQNNIITVGEDNISGNKNESCKVGTNTHGRFGGLTKGQGFVNYIYYSLFNKIPVYRNHANLVELDPNLIIIARYATNINCKRLVGSVNGLPTEENLKNLFSLAKSGDIIQAENSNCVVSAGQTMIFVGSNNAGIKVYRADALANCAVTEDVISFSALAKYHGVALIRNKNYPVEVPTVPGVVESINISATNLAKNETLTATWNAVAKADEYEVKLLNSSDSIVSEIVVKDVSATFAIENPGSYSIEVFAKNKIGKGNGKKSNYTIVHDASRVTFVDYNGTILNEQFVQYGKTAVPPETPSRKGYTFSGWDNHFENIRSNITITAQYNINRYDVKFIDYDDNKNMVVLKSQRVEYGSAATPPTPPIPKTGYVVVGWSTSEYQLVEKDLLVRVIYAWENEKLPLVSQIKSATRNTAGNGYDVTVNLTNYPTSSINAKIIVALKTAEDKMIASSVRQIFLDSNQSSDYQTFISCSGVAGITEVTTVGIADDDNTGVPLSKKVSKTIDLSKEINGAWSDWQDQYPTGNVAIESRTEYRYRDKSFTTTSLPSLSGWIKYNTTSRTAWGYNDIEGNWSPWLDYNPGKVQQQNQSVYLKTQYQYHHYRHWSKGTVWYAIGTGYDSTKHYAGEYKGHIWLDYSLTWKSVVNGHNTYEAWCPECYKSTVFYDQVAENRYKDQWRYQDSWNVYTYYYYKWLDWSTWGSTSVTANSNKEVETKTTYRFRSNDATALENKNGILRNITGSINMASANSKQATILIYKGKNTDPTASQLEYVGQTTLGANGEYSFDFKTKEEPDNKTSDFIVMLGIEGGTNPIYIDKILAPIPEYKITFVNDDGTEIATQIVNQGEDAVAPSNPIKEGHAFTTWSESISNVQRDIIISAKFIKNKYSVVFIDWETKQFTVKTFDYGDMLETPTLSIVDGIESRQWDAINDGITKVTQNMVVVTEAVLKTYTVTFKDDKGDVFSTQTVEHGKAAVLPIEPPVSAGKKFADWVGNCDYRNITRDVIFLPSFFHNETVDTPNAIINNNPNTGKKEVTLECATQNSEIYYIIEPKNKEAHLLANNDFQLLEEGEAPEDDPFKSNAIKYTGPVEINNDESIVFVAYADGMNNSLSVTEDYFSGGADIFEDGVINAKDGLKLAQYLAGCNVTLSTREQLSADIFKDNVINAKDGLKLSQFLAGWNIILGN